MCGLVGVFAFEDVSRVELTEPLPELLRRIERRGPDDEGRWDDGKRCALGFRRLAILDLSTAGHQPMSTPDGRYTLVFNGEIYNYKQVRFELERCGHRFRSTGDAEVLLVALAEWGVEALPQLNGMFAFGFYDASEQSLILARDHAGIKPLWFARTARGIVFGSQYDQLLAHPWCQRAKVDPAGLGLYLRVGFVPAPFGLHNDMQQLEAGQWVRVARDGRMARGHYFQPARNQAPTLRGEAALEAFEAAFAPAVRRHMVSDVPVGVLLSGGVDSPLVAAEARRAATAPLEAFTIGMEDTEIDESEDAKRYADELGLAAQIEHITPAASFELLDDATAACTEPTADFSIFPMLMVSRIARQRVKVVLSGDGGDELYWGYPSRFGSAIAQAPYFRWPRSVRFAAVAARKLADRGHATRDILDYATLGRLYQRKHTLMAEADLQAMFPSLPDVPREFDAFESRVVDEDEAAQWVRWNEFKVHLARVLAKVDRASMHCSLEVRVPLLDREVIEVAWRTDWRSCLDLQTKVGKRVLRSALARRVRHSTITKKGFTIPMHDWLVGPLRSFFEELVLDRQDLLGLPVAHGSIRKVYAQLLGGDRSKAWGMWLLLALALWERRFVTRMAT